ncbi:MAG: hypothetical protein KF916_06485 [Microbacteriaceae bacterium]|nr:hypothetical protein [Microbacteriaceae bacterium]
MSYEDLVREIVNSLAPVNGAAFTVSTLADIDNGEPEVALELVLYEAEIPKKFLTDEQITRILDATRPSDYLGKEILEILS